MSINAGSLSLQNGMTIKSNRLLLDVLPYILLIAGFCLAWPSVSNGSDAGWYMMLAEKILAGQRLYVDIIDPNPPASAWLYLPAAWLARILHTSTDAVVDAQLILLAGLSVWFFQHAAQSADVLRHHARHWMSAALLAVFIIMPSRSFGQRENFIAILLLPLVGTMLLRATCNRVAGWLGIVAGAGAGIAIAIKPHFALAELVLLATALILTRNWRMILAGELWLSAAVLALYLAAIALYTPQLFEVMLPIVLLAYVPIRLSVPDLLLTPAIELLLAASVLVYSLVRTKMSPTIWMLLAATLGCCLAYAVQGKGWPYQSYPMLAFMLAAIIVVFTDPAIVWKRQFWDAAVQVGIMLMMLTATHMWLGAGLSLQHLQTAMAQLKPRPRILQISEDIGIGFPLVRKLEGTWVGRVSAQWITDGKAERIQRGNLDAASVERLETYAKWDRNILLEDIRQQKPDIILVHVNSAGWTPTVDWTGWIAADADLAVEMTAYEPAGTFDGVRIMQRKAGL